MPAKKREIKFSPPDISEVEIEQIIETMRSGWITTGPRTKLMEERIAAYTGAKRAACLSSATAALELTLRILGIGDGDEVITSAYTYTASASVIEHVGAKIVLVDTAPDSYEMDYVKLEAAITRKTKAIIPVDIAGRMCDYERIFRLTENKRHLFEAGNELQGIYNRIIIIADSAHGFGASYKGIVSGLAADFTCFSFHAVKNLTTAEGGAVVWRDADGLDNDWLYTQYMLLSLHGQSKDALSKNISGSWEYDILFTAYKCNMTDLMASIGLAQLDRYEELLSRRRELIRLYDEQLIPAGVQVLRHNGDDFTSSGHLYLTRVTGADEKTRNRIIVKMAEAGIACNVHYKPLPLFTAYKNLGFDMKDYPVAHMQFVNEISLPLHTLLTNDDVLYICEKYSTALK